MFIITELVMKLAKVYYDKQEFILVRQPLLQPRHRLNMCRHYCFVLSFFACLESIRFCILNNKRYIVFLNKEKQYIFKELDFFPIIKPY